MQGTNRAYQVFLSHDSSDKPLVEQLARRLVRSGIEPWLDKWNLIPGQPWQEAIEDALEVCVSCAVFIGSNGTSPWQNEEMRAAIDRRVHDSRGEFRVIPVLLPGANRGERSRLPSFLAATTWVEFHESLEEEEPFHRLLCGIRGVEPGPSPGEAVYQGACPYRGLEFFDVDHAPFFFGREALTGWLLDELRPAEGKGSENRFLGIVGPSGSGKSSLARAGLIASLDRGEVKGSAAWPVAVIRPGAEPLENLAIAVFQATRSEEKTSSIRELIKEFRESERTLHLFARLALDRAQKTARLLVLVDQFEEVFTTCQDEDSRRALINNLLYAATVPDGRTIVVITIRADFYGHCSTYPMLAAGLSDHQVLVGAMHAEELRTAITRPAQLAGCELEPGLAETLADEVIGQPGSLPLLQYTLTELWNRRDGRRLTHAAYEAIGRVRGALEQRAERIYNQLDREQQQVCRRLFLSLAQPGEGGHYTRRQAPLSDVLPAQSGQEAVKSVLEKLTGPDARLLTIRGGGPDDDEPIIDVTHEAILRGWSRLRSWLEQDFEYQLWKKRLRDGRQDWEDNLRHPDYLLRGAQLEQAEQWSVERQDDLSQVELEFLEASAGLRTIHEEETRRHQEKLRQEQDRRLESEARAASRLRKLAVILAVLALTAAFFGYDANQKAGIALSRELATTALNQLDINPDLAVLMALSAVVNHAHTRAAEEALHQAVQTARGPAFMGHEGKVNSLTYHPDGASLATASADRTARLWDPATGVQLSALFRHQAELVDIGFSPDGDRLVLAGSDGAVEVIEVAAPDRIVSLPRHPDAVTGVSFSPDGARLATACWDGIGRIFDVESGRELFQLRGHSAGLHSIAFNADGKKVASASADGTAKVWDAQIGKELLNLGGQLGVDRGVTQTLLRKPSRLP